jgi:hypothetical protein
MATTTNYSWTTPDDTSLVKDGASAIRTLGSSIDTTTKNLNPSTTLGDIEYRSSTANTNTRLGIGTTGQVLSVSGGVPAWTTISSGGWTSLTSGNFNTAAATLNLTSISASYQALILIFKDLGTVNTTDRVRIRFNNDSTGIYYSSNAIVTSNAGTSTEIAMGTATGINSGTDSFFYLYIPNYANTTSHKVMHTIYHYQNAATPSFEGGVTSVGVARLTAAINEINVFNTGSANWSGGTYELFGVK